MMKFREIWTTNFAHTNLFISRFEKKKFFLKKFQKQMSMKMMQNLQKWLITK